MFKHSGLRFVLVIALLALSLQALTACDDSGTNPTPPPATIISATEDEPTAAPIEPQATATPLPEPPTRPPEPTAEPEGTPEDYPEPPTAVPNPEIAYPTPGAS